MTLSTLYPPIAAATIINVFLFALAWRATQEEKRRGEAPWYLAVGLTSYAALLGLYVYGARSRPLIGQLDYFAVAMAGQAMGAVVVYALLNAFVFMRGQSMKDRAFSAVLAVFLLGLMFAGLFTA